MCTLAWMVYKASNMFFEYMIMYHPFDCIFYGEHEYDVKNGKFLVVSFPYIISRGFLNSLYIRKTGGAGGGSYSIKTLLS